MYRMGNWPETRTLRKWERKWKMGGGPFSQERASAEIRGEFSWPNVWVNFALGFLGGFFSGILPWKKKNRRKKSTQKSTAKFTQTFGSFAAKIHTARICPWHFPISTAISGLAPFSIFFPVFRGFACWPEFLSLRELQKEVGKSGSIIFFRFWDSFGQFLVTLFWCSCHFFLPNSAGRHPKNLSRFFSPQNAILIFGFLELTLEKK